MNKNNKKSLLFLANPKSGKGSAESIFQKVDRVLKKNNIHSILYVSKKRGDIKHLISSYLLFSTLPVFMLAIFISFFSYEEKPSFVIIFSIILGMLGIVFIINPTLQL